MTDYATLAGGCFWCTEAVFKDVIGVESVESGYIGGHVANPTYRQVCGGDTGHAEAIRIGFDPAQVSYADLLDIFFATHDPTQLNRQGNDVGTQYRSAIFPASTMQEEQANQAIARAGGAVEADRHDDRICGRLVSGGGLPPGILGRRGTAEPLLPGRHPAQIAEAAQELRRAHEIRRRGVTAPAQSERRLPPPAPGRPDTRKSGPPVTPPAPASTPARSRPARRPRGGRAPRRCRWRLPPPGGGSRRRSVAARR